MLVASVAGRGGLGWAGAGGGLSSGAQMPSVSRTVWRVRPGPLKGDGGGKKRTEIGEGRGGVRRRYGVCVDRLMEV